MDSSTIFIIVTAISAFVTAVATIAIAYYSYESNKLSNAIEGITKQHHRDLGDLYQAIVISTLIGGHSSPEETIKKFKGLYSGEVEIFRAEEVKK